MVGATSSTMKMSWANMCRKGNGEQLVQHKGILMTPIQKAMAAHTAGVCARDDNLAKHPEQSAHDAEAGLERPPGISANESSATTSPFDTTSILETNELEPFPFFALPFDIRQEILSHVVQPCRHRVRPGVVADTPFLPIARVSKRLRIEALYIALKQTEFEVCSGFNANPITIWLANLDFSPLHGDICSHIRDGFDLVRTLSFPRFSTFPRLQLPNCIPNHHVELMKKCANLQEITLDFWPWDLVDTIGFEKGLLMTPTQLVELLRMDGILQCGKVEKIVLSGMVLDRTEEWNEDGLMTGLKQWLVDGYRKQGREVNVTDGGDRQADQGAWTLC